MNTFNLFRRLSVRIIAAVLLTFTFTFCSYDDSELRNSMQELQDRIEYLEKMSESFQDDLNSLKTIIEKIQSEVTIDNVVDNGDSYTINFSDGTSVTISDGKDGIDGTNGTDGTTPPSITIIEENGVYYWAYEHPDGTIAFITDEDGNKMPVTGQAPQVRINPDSGNWEISTDGGITWEDTGMPSAGENESIFKDISIEEGILTIELLDGTVLHLPLTEGLSFSFDSDDPLEFSNGETIAAGYTMTGAVNTSISKPDGWKVRFVENRIEITAPAAENTFAETEGTVSVIALSASGLSAFDEIAVSVVAAELTGIDLNADGMYANSYIVSEPNTTYYFDATVMGTGIATAGLEAPTALDPKDVFVIWETGTEAGNVISSVELTDDGKVVFTTSETVNGNAVIAVTDGVPVIDPYPRDRGTVLWSWHIWATPGVNDVICTNNDGEQFTIMDRNLGDWEQPESSYSTYDGLKYQWGRKDPYVGFNGSGYLLDGSVVFTEPDYEPIVGYATSTESDAATLLEAIQFPEMFFTGTYNNMFDWYGLGAGTDEENLQHRNNYLWGNPDDTAPVKTIYDPCPKGYMVAPAKVFSGFTVDGQNAWIDSSILYEGSFEDGFTFTNASSFFPAAGQLANNSGVLRLVPGPSGREGYYWTSSVGEDGDSRMVDFNKSMLLYNTNKRASGCSVRCVRVL